MTGGAPVLVVDDEAPIRRILTRLLERAGYSCDEAATVPEARAMLGANTYALVLCDVNMPGESGLTLVAELHRDHPDTAVVMVTAVDDPERAVPALELGADGYVVKPFAGNEIVINAINAMRHRRLEIENREHRDRLESIVAERTETLRAMVRKLERAELDLRFAAEETINRLALAAEFRDETTGAHLQRMSAYTALLARRHGLDAAAVESIRAASPMHDIGKVGVPEAILRKPGRLTEAETREMRRHPEIGRDLLAGSRSPLLRLGASIAYTHHERWDGTGYPQGLAGDAIPLEGRIVAVADVFDALTSERPYKPAWSIDDAFAELHRQAGRHFDPALVALFTGAADEVSAIATGG